LNIKKPLSPAVGPRQSTHTTFNHSALIAALLTTHRDLFQPLLDPPLVTGKRKLSIGKAKGHSAGLFRLLEKAGWKRKTQWNILKPCLGKIKIDFSSRRV
jgi:hypothetical protein